MPEYLALRCFSCGTFQSHQLRKDSKFSCLICKEKQSYRKVYARSFKAADIRPIVQQFNMRRGEMDEEEAEERRRKAEERQRREEEAEERGEEKEEKEEEEMVDWNAYLDPQEEIQDDGESDIATEQIRGFKMIGGRQENWERVGGPTRGRGARASGRGRGKRKASEEEGDGVTPLYEDQEPLAKRGRRGTNTSNEPTRSSFAKNSSTSQTRSAFLPRPRPTPTPTPTSTFSRNTFSSPGTITTPNTGVTTPTTLGSIRAPLNSTITSKVASYIKALPPKAPIEQEKKNSSALVATTNSAK
eukprot:TRINITY_DN1494_c1_g1_i1.p1 TRINITY_DN1494_c1_g1~~TRINITY_DN1494_c1_g1_i1.p1  ORF type:complete len:301 (-),score=83.85 TRINITY_DN1494_c1_g1_i1:333-1235(-)